MEPTNHRLGRRMIFQTSMIMFHVNLQACTLPETNMEPENRPRKMEIPIGNHHLQNSVLLLVSGRCFCLLKTEECEGLRLATWQKSIVWGALILFRLRDVWTWLHRISVGLRVKKKLVDIQPPSLPPKTKTHRFWRRFYFKLEETVVGCWLFSLMLWLGLIYFVIYVTYIGLIWWTCLTSVDKHWFFSLSIPMLNTGVLVQQYSRQHLNGQ